MSPDTAMCGCLRSLLVFMVLLGGLERAAREAKQETAAKGTSSSRLPWRSASFRRRGPEIALAHQDRAQRARRRRRLRDRGGPRRGRAVGELRDDDDAWHFACQKS